MSRADETRWGLTSKIFKIRITTSCSPASAAVQTQGAACPVSAQLDADVMSKTGALHRRDETASSAFQQAPCLLVLFHLQLPLPLLHEELLLHAAL